MNVAPLFYAIQFLDFLSGKVSFTSHGEISTWKEHSWDSPKPATFKTIRKLFIKSWLGSESPMSHEKKNGLTYFPWVILVV